MGSIFADFKRALAEEDGADKEISRARAGEVLIKKASTRVEETRPRPI